MIEKTTLVLFLQNYKIEDYNKFDKKTLSFQKLINSTENLLLIADKSLEEVTKNNRIFENCKFITLDDLPKQFNLQTNFNIEIFINSNNLFTSDYTIFFDEKCLTFHMEFFEQNQLFRMVNHYSQNILAYCAKSDGHFKKFNKILNERLKITEKNRYNKINVDFFSGRNEIIKQLGLLFYKSLEKQDFVDMDESLSITYLAVTYPKYFIFLYNGPNYKYNRFFVYFIESYKKKHNENLDEFYINLSYESHSFDEKEDYF
jgi:hypothetical protein